MCDMAICSSDLTEESPASDYTDGLAEMPAVLPARIDPDDYSMAAETHLRILIVDDQSLVRKAVRQLLESHAGWRVCGEATDGVEAVDQTRELHPDVVIMDLSMPKKDGLEATREIHASFPETHVLILTLHHFPRLAEVVRLAGAQGCVLKSDSIRFLIPAISSVSKSQPFFAA
jgi:DNA-binding NarL/FixJ family response regulator